MLCLLVFLISLGLWPVPLRRGPQKRHLAGVGQDHGLLYAPQWGKDMSAQPISGPPCIHILHEYLFRCTHIKNICFHVSALWVLPVLSHHFRREKMLNAFISLTLHQCNGNLCKCFGRGYQICLGVDECVYIRITRKLWSPNHELKFIFEQKNPQSTYKEGCISTLASYSSLKVFLGHGHS